MSMLDSFFNRGFRAAKCKTLLKLTIPRIKLLRNRREIQIKQMRKEIAKLLETGQEATARIRVEHIIREENMMAAQEILELFCELIAVRLPIIEAQRECPLDLKEAISSVCFAAPRCADLPELLQVQILFASKYGKEFLSATTELLPDCGVNRQLIELLSIRAPSPEKKLKLLKEIAEEHELDWDPAATETEFSKTHEDLLNGPTQFVSGSKLPLPKEKHDETLNTVADQVHHEQSDSDADLDTLDFPEVPKVSLRPNANAVPAPSIDPHEIPSLHPDINHELWNQSMTSKVTPEEPHLEHGEVTEEKLAATKSEIPTVDVSNKEENQFSPPFISPPSLFSPSFPTKPSSSPPPISRTKSDLSVDLHDVIAAAQAAAETAERAAAAARSAATLAQARISELTKRTSDTFPESSDENPFHGDTTDQSAAAEKPHFDNQQSFDHSDTFETPHFDHQLSFGEHSGIPDYQYSGQIHHPAGLQDLPSFDKLKVAYDSPRHDHSLQQPDSTRIQTQRLPSIDDDSYLAYPNLFSPQGINPGSVSQPGKDSSPSSHGF